MVVMDVTRMTNWHYKRAHTHGVAIANSLVYVCNGTLPVAIHKWFMMTWQDGVW